MDSNFETKIPRRWKIRIHMSSKVSNPTLEYDMELTCSGNELNRMLKMNFSVFEIVDEKLLLSAPLNRNERPFIGIQITQWELNRLRRFIYFHFRLDKPAPDGDFIGEADERCQSMNNYRFAITVYRPPYVNGGGVSCSGDDNSDVHSGFPRSVDLMSHKKSLQWRVSMKNFPKCP